MSHIDDTRERLAKLIAHFGDKRLPGGTSVEETILKLTPDAELGANMHIWARDGHEAEYGTDAQKQQRWQKYQDHVDNLYNLNPKWSYSRIIRSTAEEFKASTTTIKRRTNNPRKK